MLNKEREQEILNILKTSNGFVTVKTLCNTLFASESSIRRDLKALEKSGLIKRNYGGASLVKTASNIITFNRRTRQNQTEKMNIAKKAAALIEDGSIIFLDQSSTAFYLANEITNRPSLTVVTNNIEIMMLLSNTDVTVISSGGYLSERNRNCLIGGDAQKTFDGIFADIVFFSVKAITDDGTVTDCSREEVLVRNAMLKNSAKRVLLCDSTKFGSRAAYKQCNLNEVDYLISENENAKKFEEYKNKIILM